MRTDGQLRNPRKELSDLAMIVIGNDRLVVGGHDLDLRIERGASVCVEARDAQNIALLQFDLVVVVVERHFDRAVDIDVLILFRAEAQRNDLRLRNFIVWFALPAANDRVGPMRLKCGYGKVVRVFAHAREILAERHAGQRAEACDETQRFIAVLSEAVHGRSLCRRNVTFVESGSRQSASTAVRSCRGKRVQIVRATPPEQRTVRAILLSQIARISMRTHPTVAADQSGGAASLKSLSGNYRHTQT
ncbi:MAG: hypothetical protein QM775_29050 [Pirellulales bacterium]